MLLHPMWEMRAERLLAPETAGAISSGHEQIAFSPSKTDYKTLTFSL